MTTATEIMESAQVTELLNRIPQEIIRQRNAEYQGIQAGKRNLAVAELRQTWGAPSRQVKAAVNRSGAWADKLGVLENRLAAATGIMVALVGGRGNGKTQMAVELMRYATQNLKPARFITAIGFFIEVKATYRKESEKTEKVILAEFSRLQLLVIDEIGKRSDSNWENDLLFELLNRRYNEQRDTVLISNHTRQEFEQYIGPSIASRMHETGGVIDCTWPTFRM